MHNVVIVGAGALGREVFQWAQVGLSKEDFQIKGFLDNNPRALDGFQVSASILANPGDYAPKKEDRFVVAIGDIDTKKELVRQLKTNGAKFIGLVHPSALISVTATIGEGVLICPFACVGDNAKIGDFVELNYYSLCSHDSIVGDYSVLSPYATINGSVELEQEVFLATHSTVIARKRVGTRAKISANSVAMEDVRSRTLVFGVPGREVDWDQK